jgi:hypothetical protein
MIAIFFAAQIFNKIRKYSCIQNLYKNYLIYYIEESKNGAILFLNLKRVVITKAVKIVDFESVDSSGI